MSILKRFIFIILLLVTVSGCASDVVKKDFHAKKVKYPATAKKVVKAFVDAVKKGNFTEADNYTHKLNFNGVNYKIIKNEPEAYDEYYVRSSSENFYLIGLDFIDVTADRELNLKRVDGKWKIVETYINSSDDFKDFATFIWYIDRQNKPLTYKLYGNNKKGLTNRDIDHLLKFFKDKDPVFTYPRLGSIYDQANEHKIYKEGTREGIVFLFTYEKQNKNWTWKLGKEFRD